LRAKGPGVVIVTLGGEGLVAASAEGVVRMAASKVEVVSTHGAGDAFTGALAARLAKGDGLGEALTFAQGAAALTVATEPERRGELTDGKVRAFLSSL
jgi:ribokinase